jgi:hypothetical protein
MADRAGSQVPQSTGRTPVWLRVLASLIGIALLWQAVQFGLSGSWPLAMFFFVLFGGVEVFAFAALLANYRLLVETTVPSNSAAHPERLKRRALWHPSSRRPGGRER